MIDFSDSERNMRNRFTHCQKLKEKKKQMEVVVFAGYADYSHKS